MEDLVMAKTLEELKEAIDNIIVENDKGEITATALNMLLHDMSDTLSELGNSGGGECLYLCLGDSLEEYTDPSGQIRTRPAVKNPENLEANKKVYDTISKIKEKKPIPIYMSLSESMNSYGDIPEGYYDIYGLYATGIISMVITEDNLGEIGNEFVNYVGTEVYSIMGERACTLLNDGNIIIS